MTVGTFTNFVTKGFGTEVTKDDRRILKGHITVEIVDRQDEYVAVGEVLSVIKNYFEVSPAIHDWHSNRPVGKALKYEKSEIEGHASVYIEAEIFKKEGVTLYDNVWQKIIKGEYTGFSMGGASKIREPMVKDGKLITALKSLELYEISVCPLPANQLAIFDYVNDFAKASGLDVKSMDSGRQYIQCEGVQCEYTKNAYGNESKDLGKKDETQIVPDPVGGVVIKSVDDIIELIKQYTSFQKPIRGHSRDHWQNKLKEDNPEHTDSDVNKTIDSWEQEEQSKSKITKEMSRKAETVMDDAPKGDENKMLEKDHEIKDKIKGGDNDHIIRDIKEGEEKKDVWSAFTPLSFDPTVSPPKDENDMKPDQIVKDAGQQNSQAKAPNVKNTNPKPNIEVKKNLQSMIRKNTLINMLLNKP